MAGDEKQEADVAECGCDHAPVVQHRCLLPLEARAPIFVLKSNALRGCRRQPIGVKPGNWKRR
jgi:hypothetical protein